MNRRLKIHAALSTVFLAFVISSPLQAGEFKIRPLVMSGDPAPDGGTFLGLGQPELNGRGDIVFTGRTDPTAREGLYMLSEGSIQFLGLRGGSNTPSGRLPNPASLGITLTSCPFDPRTCSLPDFQSLEFYQLPDGHIISCDKTIFVILGEYRVNNSRDILFRQGNGVGLLSSGSINWFPCPTLEYLRHTSYDHRSIPIPNVELAGLTNTGTIALKLDVVSSESSSGGFLIDNPILLLKGGGMSILSLLSTPAPGGGTIQAVHSVKINEKETLLVPFRSSESLSGPQGLLLFSDGTLPVAFTGAPAPGGGKFMSFSGMQFPESVALNNTEQVVFAASLDDGSEGIFRRNPDGTIVTLARDHITGFTFATRFLSINEKGDVAAGMSTSEVFLFGSQGGSSRVVRLTDPAPGGGEFQSAGFPRVNNKKEIIFWGSLSDGRQGIFIAEPLQLVAGTGSGPTAPGTESTPVAGVVTAKFPLGSTFFIQLTQKNQSGNLVPIQSTFTLEPATISPAITGPNLFPNNVVIEIDRETASDIKFFQAIHLGEVVLNVTPTDTTISPAKVKIVVNQPRSLGTANNLITDRKTGEPYNLDTRLVDLGHRKGIPPHMLKGQVRQESNFDLRAYRYEPLRSDFDAISKHQNLRESFPYELYRLATTDGLTQGTDLAIPDDISPRSIYFIIRDGVRRLINDADQFVSAKEIFQVNDGTQNWSRQVRRSLATRIERNPDLLDFTAQTTIASSYGLLQILYSTAIAPMNWQGVNGHRNPSLLFDSLVNLSVGGGSLELGSSYLVRIFPRANRRVSLADPVFTSQSSFREAFRNAFNAYKFGKPVNPSPGDYGEQVLNFSDQFKAIASTSIFE